MSEEQKAKTGKERQADYRKRMKELGYKQMSVWVHDSDMPAVRTYANSLIQKRKESGEKKPG